MDEDEDEGEDEEVKGGGGGGGPYLGIDDSDDDKDGEDVLLSVAVVPPVEATMRARRCEPSGSVTTTRDCMRRPRS